MHPWPRPFQRSKSNVETERTEMRCEKYFTLPRGPWGRLFSHVTRVTWLLRSHLAQWNMTAPWNLECGNRYLLEYACRIYGVSPLSLRPRSSPAPVIAPDLSIVSCAPESGRRHTGGEWHPRGPLEPYTRPTALKCVRPQPEPPVCRALPATRAPCCGCRAAGTCACSQPFRAARPRAPAAAAWGMHMHVCLR